MGSEPDQPDYIEPPSTGESIISGMFGDSEWAQGLGLASPEVQQAILEAERQYGPEYVRNELARQEAAYFGQDGQAGLLDQSARAAPIVGGIQADLLTQQRGRDIGDVEALGTRATDALRASDPDRQALIGQQRALTDDLFARAQGVTGQQRRMAEQGAREAYGDRGRDLDNASIFSEALGREEFMRQNRAEAQQAGAGLFGMYQATSADPFAAILGRASGAAPYAQHTGQQALGMGQENVFNTDSLVNLAQQQNANVNNYNADVYGAQAARQGNIMGGFLPSCKAARKAALRSGRESRRLARVRVNSSETSGRRKRKRRGRSAFSSRRRR
jgi:hypothetical protein